MDFSDGDFEWDENKRRINLGKHGIDFIRARLIFDDEHHVILRSPVEQPEMRFLAIGMLSERLVTVVFTFRGSRIRLISARRARIAERRAYEQRRHSPPGR